MKRDGEFFWDSHGIVLCDYLKKGKTTTGKYYAPLVGQMKAKIAKKRLYLIKKKVLFHQDNVLSHISTIVVAKVNELQFDLIDYHPDSSDLAPRTFFCFLNLKFSLEGKGFVLTRKS